MFPNVRNAGDTARWRGHTGVSRLHQIVSHHAHVFVFENMAVVQVDSARPPPTSLSRQTCLTAAPSLKNRGDRAPAGRVLWASSRCAGSEVGLVAPGSMEGHGGKPGRVRRQVAAVSARVTRPRFAPAALCVRARHPAPDAPPYGEIELQSRSRRLAPDQVTSASRGASSGVSLRLSCEAIPQGTEMTALALSQKTQVLAAPVSTRIPAFRRGGVPSREKIEQRLGYMV